MFGIVRIVGPQVLDAVHELRHARGDVVVAVEADGAVCYGLGPVSSLIEQVGFTATSEGCLRLGIWPTHDDMVFGKTLLQLQEEPGARRKPSHKPNRFDGPAGRLDLPLD